MMNQLTLIRKYYNKNKQILKLKSLMQYFKYHEEVPRVFSNEIKNIAHNFYDKKRRINYLGLINEISGLDKKT